MIPAELEGANLTKNAAKLGDHDAGHLYAASLLYFPGSDMAHRVKYAPNGEDCLSEAGVSAGCFSPASDFAIEEQREIIGLI